LELAFDRDVVKKSFSNLALSALAIRVAIVVTMRLGLAFRWNQRASQGVVIARLIVDQRSPFFVLRRRHIVHIRSHQHVNVLVEIGRLCVAINLQRNRAAIK
jgi:hypothetical protein